MSRYFLAGIVAIFLGSAGYPVLASAAGSSDAGDQPLVLKGLTNEDGMAKLADYLTKHGIQAENKEGKIIQVKYDNGKFLMKTSLSEDGIDRIIVYKIFKVNEEKRNAKGLEELVAALNRKLNIGAFSLTEGNKSLVLQGYVTFMDTLPEREMREYLRWFNRAIVAAIAAIPELRTYLD